jgi:hypothetical protein
MINKPLMAYLCQPQKLLPLWAVGVVAVKAHGSRGAKVFCALFLKKRFFLPNHNAL